MFVTVLAEDFQASEEAKTSVSFFFFSKYIPTILFWQYKYMAGMDEAMSIAISING